MIKTVDKIDLNRKFNMTSKIFARWNFALYLLQHIVR